MPRQTPQERAVAQAKAQLAARLRKIQRDNEYGAAFVLERAQRSLPQPTPGTLRELWGLPKLGLSKSNEKATLNSVRDAVLSPSQAAKTFALKNESAAEHEGRKRARVVATLLSELNELRPHMTIPDDDYPKLSRQNPKYLVFKICKKHPAAARWVKLLPERRSVHSLAYELAAVSFGIRAATIETAWKRYKQKARGKR